MTTVRVLVSGVFTQRTQISPFTLDVTTNRYFIVQRGNPNIYSEKKITIVISHSPHTHDLYNSPTVRHHVRGHYSFFSRSWTLFILFTFGHYSFFSRSWTLFILFTFVDTIHSFHVRGHYSFFSRSCTLFIPFTFVDTIHSFHVRGHYSFLSLSWTLFILFTFVDTIHSFHFRGHCSCLSLSFLSGTDY